MKKKGILLVLSSLLLVSCKTYTNKVTIDDINNKISNEESFAYFLGKDDCSSCLTLERNIRRNSLQNNIFYVDINELSTESYNAQVEIIKDFVSKSFMNNNGYIMYEYALYTPSTIRVVNGEVVSVFVGSMSKSEVSEYKNNNFVDLYYYEKFLEYVDSKDFDIYFIKDSKLDEYLKKDYTELTYFIKYSSLTSNNIDDLLSKANQVYSINITDIEDVDEIHLNYKKMD